MGTALATGDSIGQAFITKVKRMLVKVGQAAASLVAASKPLGSARMAAVVTPEQVAATQQRWSANGFDADRGHGCTRNEHDGLLFCV